MTNFEVKLPNFPLLQQLDNQKYPEGSCNLTSVAMCLTFLKAERDPRYRAFRQFEDELLQRCDDNGWDRHEPSVMKKIVELYGFNDELLIVEGWGLVGEAVYRIIENLKKNKPVVVHTYLTRSGHIVCIDGVRMSEGKPVQWHVADPYGEFYPDGYDKNYGGDKNKGHYWLSHNRFTSSILTDGILWAHLIY
jgi:hypothetical protein